jgi:hypothetical protein
VCRARQPFGVPAGGMLVCRTARDSGRLPLFTSACSVSCCAADINRAARSRPSRARSGQRPLAHDELVLEREGDEATLRATSDSPADEDQAETISTSYKVSFGSAVSNASDSICA